MRISPDELGREVQRVEARHQHYGQRPRSERVKVRVRRRGKRGTYCAEFWHAGQHHRRSLKTADLGVARKRAVQIEAQLILGGQYAPPSRPVDLNTAMEEYLAEPRRHKTTVKYRQWMTKLVEFCAGQNVRTLHQVTHDTYSRFHAAQAVSQKPKSLYTGLTIVKQFFRWCSGGTKEYLTKNPVAKCKVKKPYEPPKFTPTKEQLDAILAAAGGDRRRQYALAAFAGLRAEEIQKMPPRGVDRRGHWVQVMARDGWLPKTGQARKVPVHPRLRKFLYDLPEDDRAYLLQFFSASSTSQVGKIT